MVIKLNRIYEEKVTPGTLFINGKQKCYTLERPWVDNERTISCIPEGCYEIGLKLYGKWHERWKDKDWYRGVIMLHGTEPRSEILIHTANYVRQLNGCIAPGLSFGKEGDGVTCIWNSRQALLDLYPVIADAIFAKEYVELQIESNEVNKKD